LHEGADTLVVEVVFIEGDVGEQLVQPLLAGVGDDLGEGIAVFVGVFGEQSGEVTLEGLSPLGAAEVDMEGTEELVQFRQSRRGCMRLSFGYLHTSLYARSDQVTK